MLTNNFWLLWNNVYFSFKLPDEYLLYIYIYLYIKEVLWHAIPRLEIGFRAIFIFFHKLQWNLKINKKFSRVKHVSEFQYCILYIPNSPRIGFRKKSTLVGETKIQIFSLILQGSFWYGTISGKLITQSP